MDIIVDVDGTLADCSHRQHWVQSKPPNWDAFLKPEAVMLDTPINHVLDLVRVFICDNVIITSARNERHRKVTADWLDKHDLSYDKLYLRADGDMRPDTEVKREILQQIRADGYNPTIAIDDRLSVCKMWAEEGLFVFCVNQGLKEF